MCGNAGAVRRGLECEANELKAAREDGIGVGPGEGNAMGEVIFLEKIVCLLSVGIIFLKF